MDQFYVESGYVNDGYIVYIADANVGLVSNVQLAGNESAIRSTMIDLAVDNQITINSNRIVEANANFIVEFGLSATYGGFTTAIVNLTSDLNITATPVVNRSTTMALDTIVTLSIQAQVLKPQSVQLETNFVESSTPNRTRDTSSVLGASVTLEANAERIASTSLSLNAAFTQVSTNNRIREQSANFTSNFTIRSVVGLPTIKYVYIIPYESRVYIIKD